MWARLKWHNKIFTKSNRRIKRFKKKIVAQANKTYRITSYYTGDSTGSGSTTASGLQTKDFQINEKGWYTYKGKVVVATANRSLLKYGWPAVDGITYYKLYDTFTLVIDGISYPAIVLDSCGACMKKNIIDVFVIDRAHMVSGTAKVKKSQ